MTFKFDKDVLNYILTEQRALHKLNVTLSTDWLASSLQMDVGNVGSICVHVWILSVGRVENNVLH